MRKIVFILILISGIIGSLSVFAQGIEEEARGKAILEKLETREVSCENLTDDDFEALGEYFMGQMTGTSHEAMNNMMIQMMGKEGEEKMHVVMGKRMSGCDANAQMSQDMMNMPAQYQTEGFGIGLPMMGGMMNSGGWGIGKMMGWDNLNFWSGWGWIAWIFMILFWILIILAIAALIKWLIDQISGGVKGKSALDILKERYAKGEISKEEFEEKKKDLI